MSLEVTHNTKTGEFAFKLTKHVLNVIGASLVISGFASLSSPWWMALVDEVLEKSSIQIQEDYQWAISGVQIVIGFFLLTFKYFFLDKREKQREQDRHTWIKRGLNIDRITHYFNELVDDHSYISSDDTEFYNSFSCFLEPQNSFQFGKTKKAYQAYSNNARSLREFVGTYFWVFPRSQTSKNDYRYCLAPHLNEDREGDPSIENSKQYSSLSVELHKLQKQTKESFERFIHHLKEVGHI